MSLKGTQTENNLQHAFATESQANRRFLYFAEKADIEGYPAAANVFKAIADGETGHAHGHLEYLAASDSGDPATGHVIGATSDNFASAIARKTYEYAEMYPGFAQAARAEGFHEIADWFEMVARAEKAHVERFQEALDSLEG